MAATKTKLKEFHVTLRLNVDVGISVLATTVEEAIIKGREAEKDWDGFLQVDEIQDGSAELLGVWTVD